MSAQTQREENRIRRLPMDEDNNIIDRQEFTIQSPAKMIMMGHTLMGKTMTMVNTKKIMIGDTLTETKYFECTNKVHLSVKKSKDPYKKLKNGVYIPMGLAEVVNDLYHTNCMDEYRKLQQRLDLAHVPEEKVKIFNALKEHIAKMRWPIFALDNLTQLQEMNYSATLHAYNLEVRPDPPKMDIRKVDKYSGVNYTRPNFFGILEYIESYAAPFIIYVAHVKNKKDVIGKDTDDLTPLDVALDGIAPYTITRLMSAVAIFNRNNEGCFLDFNKRTETDLGARPVHLRNKIIKIADFQTDPKVYPTRYWQEIYPDLIF
ncbi:hypothetical protein SAMN05428988_3257 [Chitinophaga sp. YR573]|uniref:hypothetical protein n=1 Tax=Chitinophaga sp. YR573 TaxID=1881040 RepID=UPI0008CE69FB|nr:hypothetical protein [Chitinophaga sp. YR573]SEW21852.1 hypothetical protein SAMN05428988_3257 [Chitinophaga sp. YR573]